MSKPSLQETIECHRKDLMCIDGIVGVGAGACASDRSRHCIIVYANCDEWPEDLPHELDGYPVEMHKATGFHAL